jgi:hypothetical protein
MFRRPQEWRHLEEKHPVSGSCAFHSVAPFGDDKSGFSNRFDSHAEGTVPEASID